MDRLKKEDGFTLIELVIVLTIIGIIIAIAVPGFKKQVEVARVNADKASAKTIKTAAHMALLDGKDGISVENLVRDGYLDSNPKAQVKGKNEFKVEYKDEVINVIYDDGKEIDNKDE